MKLFLKFLRTLSTYPNHPSVFFVGITMSNMMGAAEAPDGAKRSPAVVDEWLSDMKARSLMVCFLC